MRCPECQTRLVLQAFWQGRYVNCTSCGARLQRSLAGIVLSAVAGLFGWGATMYVLDGSGLPMEAEIAIGLLALVVCYLVVHVLTLHLKPREEEPTLKL